MFTFPEVLLVSYSDIKQTIQDKIGMRCEDVKMEEMAVAAVKKVIAKADNKKFFKFIIVDLDEVSIIIERFGRSIKSLLIEAGIPPGDVQLIAVSSTPSDKQKLHCVRANFTYIEKPLKNMQLDAFRFMIDPKTVATGGVPKSRASMIIEMQAKQFAVEKTNVDQVNEQSVKLAQQEKDYLDKFMNEVKETPDE